MADGTQSGTTLTKSSILTQRYSELQGWLKEKLNKQIACINPMAGDASFRRYYRVRLTNNETFVAMDAPRHEESCIPYLKVAQIFKKLGVCVPDIYEQELKKGFLILADLGDRLYFDEINEQNADLLYGRAFDALLKIQQADSQLPNYSDELYLMELHLFMDWYLAKYRKMALSSREKALLEQLFFKLIHEAQSQPQVCVHRDYHSRNLLLLEGEVGVLDFQDALIGPLTYDLVSLLKDCYIEWPIEKIQAWLQNYYNCLKNNAMLDRTSFEQFVRWFDLMGLQRHLKCLGIFSRLHLRDQKSNYLADIPRVLGYVKSVCEQYVEYSDILSIIYRE
jgi:N-acetylmuramate 1-kinase